MPRVFLVWAAFLAAASWAGIALAEAACFSAAGALGAGAVVAGAAAIAATATVLPAVDTTLLSQDASIHRASGRWLARAGTLAIPDPVLAEIPAEARVNLFEMGAVGLTLVSESRLPGGLVVPGRGESVVYPSFAHLLAVWIAIADRVAGEAGIALLPGLFAATAWWAVGLAALASGSAASAVATVALLASWLPEHWFARFLMPEIMAQALVWAGFAAAAIASASARDEGDGGSLVAGLVCGASLGVAAFARLEQLTIFVPALLIARGLLASGRRVLPRGAALVFALAVAHATAHLAIVPTDYGKRISRVLVDAVAIAWVALGATPARVLASLVALSATAIALTWILHRRRRGLPTRVAAGVAGIALFAAILRGRIPDELPAVEWLAWYVPWPAWAAALLGSLPWAPPSGLGVALFIEALDQVVSPRVTAEQVWAARRLVTVVLPLAAVAAGWAIARRDRPRSRGRALLGGALVALAVAIGAARLAPIAGRPIQAGGGDFVRAIAGALPPQATVVVAQPLDWLHVAPSLWLEHGREPFVARDMPRFVEGLAWLLEHRAGRDVWALSGAVAEPGESVEPAALLPTLPPGWSAHAEPALRWRFRWLERTTDRAPARLVEREATVQPFRLEPPRS